MKTPVGVKGKDVILSDSARLAATPFPCGQCLHCRINKAREWANRLLLEQKVHVHSSFITLTYNEENVSQYGDLVKTDLQKWIKRFYHYFDYFRYFGVGEYGDKTWRPHYHVAAFGVPLSSDTEKLVEKTWKKGFIHVGELNRDSARYIVGYVVKGLRDPGYYKLRGLEPEFSLCSRRPGIGYPAIEVMAKKVNSSKYKPETDLNTIRIGGKKVLLGRYLVDKFRLLTDHPEINSEMAFYEYQKKIFDENITEKEFDSHFDNLLDNNEAMRISKEKRHKIFNARKKL